MTEHPSVAPATMLRRRRVLRSIVVVGASLAGHHAARTLRGLGYDGTLTVIGDEPHRPYDRYPLSKAFLTGQTDRQGLDLADGVPDVVWRLGVRATGVDVAGRIVTLDDDTRIPFDGLVVASGARPRDAATVLGNRRALALRTVEDAIRLRAALTAGPRRVVVVGGGLIGAEIASVAVGMGHCTTLVDSSDLPTRRSLGGPVADHLLGLHGNAGVRVIPRSRVRQLRTKASATSVLLHDGRLLPADLVVMATGTRPNVAWLEGCGLTVADGLACGPTLHAVACDWVVGAGDVVRAPHPLLGDELVRAEHWSSALDLAALAAANLLSGPKGARPLTAVPMFGTSIHGAQIRAVGFPQAADRSEIVWGSIESGAAVVTLLRGQRPVAAVSLNASDRLAELGKSLLRIGSSDELPTWSEPTGLPTTGSAQLHCRYDA